MKFKGRQECYFKPPRISHIYPHCVQQMSGNFCTFCSLPADILNCLYSHTRHKPVQGNPVQYPALLNVFSACFLFIWAKHYLEGRCWTLEASRDLGDLFAMRLQQRGGCPPISVPARSDMALATRMWEGDVNQLSKFKGHLV